MMSYNCAYRISGISYIGNPKNNTAMFISKKVEYLVASMADVRECIVFAEHGIVVPEEISAKNQFVFSKHPQLEYARFVSRLYDEEILKERNYKYMLTDKGYYIGEKVLIGENVIIEPGCVIGHNVIIGHNTVILANSVVKNAVIGHDCLINEFANIGGWGFSLTKDENGDWFRIPTMGKVMIGNYVEIGAHDNIARGTAGDTMIDDFVKIDALVHIGHDAVLKRNVEITAGGIIGGFATLENDSSVGINATIRNRIIIGKNSMVGMSSAVTKEVLPDQIVIGNPAQFYKDK